MLPENEFYNLAKEMNYIRANVVGTGITISGTYIDKKGRCNTCKYGGEFASVKIDVSYYGNVQISLFDGVAAWDFQLKRIKKKLKESMKKRGYKLILEKDEYFEYEKI